MLKRLSNWFRGFFNRYEGAQRNGPGRSYLPGWVQDARFDADSATRVEILRKARYWERNSAIVNRLADVFELFTVGCGVPVVPASSDEDWNVRAKVWFEDWSKFPDLSSKARFSTVQSLIARTWLIDGEIFVHKTKGESGRPRIQLIESHRVGTPPHYHEKEGLSIIDGVQINDAGRPIVYWVRNSMDGDFKPISSDDMIHVFEPSRPGMYRGLSYLYPVLNDIHDLDDLEILEQRAARDASGISNVIENGPGEVTASSIRRARYDTTAPTSTGGETTEQKSAFYQKALGGKTIALRTGETIKQFQSNRPSVAMQSYWDFKISKICVGVGMSKQLVFPESMQGTVTRLDVDVCAAFFKARSEVLASVFTEIYIFVMGFAKNRDSAVADAPADWTKVSVRAPKAVNVDVGRNSAAILAELAAGTRTYQSIYGEQGQDEFTQLEQKAKEAAKIRELAIKYGIDPSEISDIQLMQPNRAPIEADPALEVDPNTEGEPA